MRDEFSKLRLTKINGSCVLGICGDLVVQVGGSELIQDRGGFQFI